jgi:hypothetical protein
MELYANSETSSPKGNHEYDTAFTKESSPLSNQRREEMKKFPDDLHGMVSCTKKHPDESSRLRSRSNPYSVVRLDETAGVMYYALFAF